jgi:hypothetical protein
MTGQLAARNIKQMAFGHFTGSGWPKATPVEAGINNLQGAF